MSSELSGVRSSWLMFARNSLLYFEVSASCAARSSSAWRASSISRFLSSMSRFCSASSAAFSCELLVGLLQLLLLGLQQLLGGLERLRLLLELGVGALQLLLLGLQLLGLLLQLCASRCDCSSSSSVRGLAMIALRTTPIVSMSCSRNAWWTSVNGAKRAELDDRHDLLLEEHRQHDDVDRRRLAEAGRDLDVVRRRLRDQDRLALERRLPDQRLADLEAVRDALALLVAVGRDEPQLGVLLARRCSPRQEERAVLGARRAG